MELGGWVILLQNQFILSYRLDESSRVASVLRCVNEVGWVGSLCINKPMNLKSMLNFNNNNNFFLTNNSQLSQQQRANSLLENYLKD